MYLLSVVLRTLPVIYIFQIQLVFEMRFVGNGDALTGTEVTLQNITVEPLEGTIGITLQNITLEPLEGTIEPVYQENMSVQFIPP